MRVGPGQLNRTTRCCTRRRIGLIGVEDEVGWHAMEAAGKSKFECTHTVPTAVPDPPGGGGVKVELETGTKRPTQNDGIVASEATEKASAGRSVPIQTNPDPARPVGRTGKARTTQKD